MTHYEKRRRAQEADAVVGVDAGKRKHALVIRPRGAADSAPVLFNTDIDGYTEAVDFICGHVPAVNPSRILVGIEFAGNYGFTFAHHLRDLGFQVVNVLGAHSKRWKEVVHNQRLKTDPKDAVTITDLVSRGHFVSFPFLAQEYADLRYLVSMREPLTMLRSGSITRMKDSLQVVWPEFERRFPNFNKKTPIAILQAYPCAQAFLEAPKRSVVRVMKEAGRGHLGAELYEEMVATARRAVALDGAQGVLRTGISNQLRLIAEYEAQIEAIEEMMVDALKRVPEGASLLSIPKLGPVTAAVFLGSIGDAAPRADA